MKIFDKKLYLLTPIFISVIFPLKPSYADSFPLSLQIAQSVNQKTRSFFETGRLASEDRLRFQSPPSGVIPIRENSGSWQFIISKEGNVSFWIPPGVVTDESVVLPTDLGELSFRTLASNTDDRRYVVAYTPSLTTEQLVNNDVLLQALLDKVAPSNQFKLIDNQSIRLGIFPGRELRLESADETIIFRAYLANRRAYVLGIRYPKDKPEDRQTRAFLNALQFLPNP